MHGVPYSTAGTEVFSLASLRCISLTLQTMIMTITSECLTTAVLSLRPLLMITNATPSPCRPTTRRQRTARRPRRTNRSCVRTSPRSGSGRTSTPATGTAAAATCSCGGCCPHSSAAVTCSCGSCSPHASAAALLTSQLLFHLLHTFLPLLSCCCLTVVVAPLWSCCPCQQLFHLSVVATTC